jgi:hypothetical protein
VAASYEMLQEGCTLLSTVSKGKAKSLHLIKHHAVKRYGGIGGVVELTNSMELSTTREATRC